MHAGENICQSNINMHLLMENVTRENFISCLQNYHVLRPHQYQNAVRLSEVSCKFLTRAKIRITTP